jgi:hypothetical protein
MGVYRRVSAGIPTCLPQRLLVGFSVVTTALALTTMALPITMALALTTMLPTFTRSRLLLWFGRRRYWWSGGNLRGPFGLSGLGHGGRLTPAGVSCKEPGSAAAAQTLP